MSFLGRTLFSVLAAVWLMAAGGCSPSESSSQEEEKEPHFVLGNSRFNDLDYPRAIEAFQQSLEVNPHSAQAHYRLAQLYDTKVPDPAAAVYHYQTYLQLNPQADNADIIKQRIITCKQQLAADVMSMPTAPAAMKQIEQLTEEKRRLQQQVEQLNESVKQWSTLAATLQAAAKTNNAGQTYFTGSMPGTSLTPDDTSSPAPTSRTTTMENRPTATRTTARSHTHVVVAGETLAGIARKHGISLTSLQSANPGVSPKKLKVGQTLNLP